MGHEKRAGAREKEETRIPSHILPLLHRLMTPGAPALDMTDWELVYAYRDTEKAKRNRTP